ncbi:MAG: cell division protein SepF [Clostridia bacterium]|nr:cell division protein SepF [Clostridia bacterium]
MGLFDWMLHGLGFETTTKKEKKKKEKIDNKYTDFNLHEKVSGETANPDNVPKGNMPFNNNFGMQSESNIIMVEPKNQKDIQQVVDYLKQGQSVAVNLENIADSDRSRILDFLSGAIYGVDGSIHRWHGDLFLLAPEGHKILKKG